MEKSDAELFDAILRNTAEAPFNYDAYHEFLNEKVSEI